MKRATIGLLLLFLAGCGRGPANIDLNQYVTVDGLPIEVYNCVLDRWNDVVDEWNELITEEDGVQYPDFDAWAEAHGHPLSYEQVRNDPTIVEACGG